MRRFVILVCAFQLLLFPWLVVGPVLSGLFPVCPVLHVQAGRNESNETKHNSEEMCSSLTDRQTDKQTNKQTNKRRRSMW